MRFQSLHRAVVERDREAAEHRRGHVVGMALDLRSQREHRDRVGVDPQVEQGRRRDHAGDRRRGGRAEASLERDQVPAAASERGEWE
jgi:hypothetical protein